VAYRERCSALKAERLRLLMSIMSVRAKVVMPAAMTVGRVVVSIAKREEYGEIGG